MALILFEDIFDVKDIDPDGKKFERGTLCTCILFANYVLHSESCTSTGNHDFAITRAFKFAVTENQLPSYPM